MVETRKHSLTSASASDSEILPQSIFLPWNRMSASFTVLIFFCNPISRESGKAVKRPGLKQTQIVLSIKRLAKPFYKSADYAGGQYNMIFLSGSAADFIRWHFSTPEKIKMVCRNRNL